MIDEISDKIDDTIDEFWSLDLNDADSKDKDEVIRLLRKAVIRNDSAEPSGKISKQQTNDTQDESGTSHTDDLKTTTKQSDWTKFDTNPTQFIQKHLSMLSTIPTCWRKSRIKKGKYKNTSSFVNWAVFFVYVGDFEFWIFRLFIASKSHYTYIELLISANVKGSKCHIHISESLQYAICEIGVRVRKN